MYFVYDFNNNNSHPELIVGDRVERLLEWWRLPREKTPHRAPPCEELDPPYDIKLVFCAENYILFLRKSTKTVVTRAALFDSSMHQIVCLLGLRPRPHWGSLRRSPRPPTCI